MELCNYNKKEKIIISNKTITTQAITQDYRVIKCVVVEVLQ
jgi:hypothetical protein